MIVCETSQTSRTTAEMLFLVHLNEIRLFSPKMCLFFAVLFSAQLQSKTLSCIKLGNATKIGTLCLTAGVAFPTESCTRTTAKVVLSSADCFSIGQLSRLQVIESLHGKLN